MGPQLATCSSANGARLYLDVGSPPRVRHARVRLHPRPRRPRQGGGAHPRAAARLAPSSASREEGIRGDIYLFKNNTDSAGNTYGCHENYLTSRRDDFGQLRRRADPVPRSAGRSTPAPARSLQTARGAMYCIAPAGRAHLGGRLARPPPAAGPIINTRDEPHADAERYRRLHVIVGDSNMSEYATFLKVGAACDHAADARGPDAWCCAT